MWKYRNFSVTQIFWEINFDEPKSLKTAFLRHFGDFKVWFWCISRFYLPKSIVTTSKWSKWQFFKFWTNKNQFHINSSAWRKNLQNSTLWLKSLVFYQKLQQSPEYYILLKIAKTFNTLQILSQKWKKSSFCRSMSQNRLILHQSLVWLNSKINLWLWREFLVSCKYTRPWKWR